VNAHYEIHVEGYLTVLRFVPAHVGTLVLAWALLNGMTSGPETDNQRPSVSPSLWLFVGVGAYLFRDVKLSFGIRISARLL
jgi:hypothetical protein